MASNNENSEDQTDRTFEGPRGDEAQGEGTRSRRWVRWIFGLCGVLAIAIAAGVFWRLPLAGMVLRAGLDRAGFEDAAVSVSDLSTSHIKLTDVRLGAELSIGTAEAKFDLLRLPENPFTRFAFDGVRVDLTGTDSTLMQKFGKRREDAVPETIRTLTDRVAGLPAVSVKNLSLRYSVAGSAVTLTGSGEADPEDDGAYAVQLAMRLAGELDGAAHVVAVDGTARVATQAVTVEVQAKTPDGAAGGMLSGRIDMSSDEALVSGDARLELQDPVNLAGLVPALEGASGTARVAARTMKPLSIGLDTPLDVRGLTEALQRASASGIKISAAMEDGVYAAEEHGVNDADGTFSALLRSMANTPGQMVVDGTLSLRAMQVMAAPVTADKANLSGSFRITRQDDTFTVVFPKPIRIGATNISIEDGAISVAPVAMTLSGGRTHAIRIGPGDSRTASLRLRLDVGKASALLQGEPARHVDIAPFILRLAGTANHQGALEGHFRIPKLSVAEGTRTGVIDELAMTVQRSGTSATGNLRGRVSADDGGKTLLHPILVQTDISLWRDVLTFDGTAVLPGLSVATAKGRHDFFAGKGTAALALPAFRISPAGEEFRALAPSVSSFDIRSGTVAASADLAWDRKAFDGTAAVGIEDMNLLYSDTGTTIEGLNANIRLDRILSPRTPPGQTVSARYIGAGIAFENFALRFALQDGVSPQIPAVHIEGFETAFAGGRLSVAPTVLDSAAEASQATIVVENVDLAALFDVVGLEGVSGTGRLTGAIPVKMTGRAVGIAGGRLTAVGPGVLRIRSDAAKQALARGGADVALMLSALEDFRYETLTVDIEKEAAGEGRIVLRTRGRNPAVRDGQPFVINLNVSGNVDRLVMVAAQALQLPNTLLRTMVPR